MPANTFSASCDPFCALCRFALIRRCKAALGADMDVLVTTTGPCSAGMAERTATSRESTRRSSRQVAQSCSHDAMSDAERDHGGTSWMGILDLGIDLPVRGGKHCVPVLSFRSGA